MANKTHLKIINQGPAAWNRWRRTNPKIIPDLSGANLGELKLEGVNLRSVDLSRAVLNPANLIKADFSESNLEGTNLCRCNLRGAKFHLTNARGAWFGAANLVGAQFLQSDLNNTYFYNANLRKVRFEHKAISNSDMSFSYFQGATLRNVDLSRVQFPGVDFRRTKFTYVSFRDCDLSYTKLSRINLREAELSGSNLTEADLTRANLNNANCAGVNFSQADLRYCTLIGANLNYASLVETKLNHANLSGCYVFGVSAWGVQLDEADQTNLIISGGDEPDITVDYLEVAQFVYLLINNRKIRQVIDTVTSKVVLILGRFSRKRKLVLEMLREELRSRNYLPILFDFEKSSSLDFTETITLLARMARFVVVDLTEPSSVPQELQAIIPHTEVPIQPLIEAGCPYALFNDYRKYYWVLEPYQYRSVTRLKMSIDKKVIAPAELKLKEISGRKEGTFGFC